ncbi:MAG: efflux RND transporter periplasmic adaptor subunit [Planctomycetota bacterium]
MDGVKTARVGRGPFNVVVVEEGELRAVRQTTITANVSEKIEWLVPEGAEVQKGDVLVELEKKEYEEEQEKTEVGLKEAETQLEDLVDTIESQKKELEDQVRVADVALKVAELKLKMLKESPTDREKEEAEADLESAKLQVKEAELDLNRTRKLAAEGIAPDIDLRKALMKARIARAEADAAEFARQTLLKGPSDLDLREAELAVESARLERELASETFVSARAKLEGDVEELTAKVRKLKGKIRRTKAKIEARTVRAPHDGIVMYHKQWHRESKASKIEVGARVWPGMALIELPDLRRMKVLTQVSEFVIRYVRVGLPVTVKVDLIPDRTYAGKLTWIDRWGRDKNVREEDTTGRRQGLAGFNVFAVEVEILEEDPRLKLGFKARSTIPIKQLADAVHVPREAIFLRDHQPYVKLLQNNAVIEREVVLGEENEESFVIVSGLAGGEEIILP